jgi:hypothetical protein
MRKGEAKLVCQPGEWGGKTRQCRSKHAPVASRFCFFRKLASASCSASRTESLPRLRARLAACLATAASAASASPSEPTSIPNEPVEARANLGNCSHWRFLALRWSPHHRRVGLLRHEPTQETLGSSCCSPSLAQNLRPQQLQVGLPEQEPIEETSHVLVRPVALRLSPHQQKVNLRKLGLGPS